jgi:4'-phosphopantetheinyl transferase
MQAIPNLSADDVHIWQIALSGDPRSIHGLRSSLSQDEIQRADRFHFDRHRESFIIAHAAVRQILARYVNVAPLRLAFLNGEQGKPELVAECGGGHLRFNLSHSGSFALLAVAEGLTLGVDIERVNAEFAGEEIAERFFSSHEVVTLRAVAADAKADAFFSCWTRKEAFIKALGGGLSIPLDSFEVAFGPGVPPALLRVPATAEAKLWSLYDIPAPQGYKAALVIEGKNHRLRQLRWESDSDVLTATHP